LGVYVYVCLLCSPEELRQSRDRLKKGYTYYNLRIFNEARE